MTRFRVAMLSVHTCPLAALGAKETGGMNVYVRELSRELGRMGVEVDVFTRSQNPRIPRVVSMGDGVRVIHVAAGPETPLPRDAVADHLEEFVEGVEAERIACDAEYGVIYAHYWLSGLVALALRERWSVPVLQMFHTLARLKNAAARSEIDVEPRRRDDAETMLVHEVDRLVAATVVERDHLVRSYGVDPARVAVIPCGVNTDLFRPGDRLEAREALGLDASPVVLFVGRLAPIKGLDTLFGAAARLRQRGPVRLLVIGGDADESLDGHEAFLRRRIAEDDLAGAVSFLGPQPQERLRKYFVAADVTVLPSYYESFGMAALEAMACGSPVVASRVGGLTTTVVDDVTGFLVPEGDVAALADRLGELIGDADRRERMGREGVRWAARHRWPCVAEAVCREFASLEPLAERHLAAARCH